MRLRRRGIEGICIAALLLPALLQTGCGNKAEATASEDKAPDPVAVEITTAQTRMMETTVTAQGTLTAGQGASARLAASIPGRVLSVRVKEGDTVSPGEVVAVVDNRTQQASAVSAAAAAAAAESQAREADIGAGAAAVDQSNAVRLAQLGLQSAQLDRENNIQSAQTALDAARTDYQKTKAGARPQEVAVSEQAVKQAAASRDRAATEVDRVKFLYEKGISAKRQLDDAQTALAVAESSLESAQQQVSLLRAGARAEDLRAAELRVQQAQQALAQAKMSGDARIAQAQAALRQARQSALQVEVKRQDARSMRELAAAKRADLAAARSTAAYAEIRAPFRGIVTKRALNPGDMADVTTPILEISEVKALNLLANTTANEGLQVRTGMQAHITAPDVPNRVYSGTVLNVGQVDPQTNLLAVRLSVSNARGSLRPGTFATAEIVVRTNPHAVVVPKQAILSREGKSVVFVVGPDNVAHQKDVALGAENSGLVEVTKGIRPGDRVIKLGQYEIVDSSKVKPVESADEPGGDHERAADR